VHWAQARSQSKKKESGQALPDNWEEAWQQMWRLAQELGLGANRSQGVGKFNVTRFDRA
jgi:diketogulonate reductase-like aldo/keto reductase